MRRKILFGVDYTDSELIKLLLYLFVGGLGGVGLVLHFLPLSFSRLEPDLADYVGNSLILLFGNTVSLFLGQCSGF